jgi:hypothetical protein
VAASRFGGNHTQWNFQDVLGTGYTIGRPNGRDEMQLRLAYFSNPGLENPKPGETCLQLRFARRFWDTAAVPCPTTSGTCVRYDRGASGPNWFKAARCRYRAIHNTEPYGALA